ncbi:MAG: hypothetical protein II269_00520 [Bacteroidaceae bacterium]|nr:hypothetical protein [Bacteroidaceae bacterium]
MVRKATEAIDKQIQIELAKGSLDVYRKLLKEVDKLPSLIVEITTREGNKKAEIHPIVTAINQSAETLRRQLSELLVTPKSKGTRSGRTADTTDDPLATLLEKINDISDD